MDKKKIVYQLDTPYSVVQWPHVALEHQETILELLCALLTPLGEYRAEHTQPSKGRRDRKRKRRAPSSRPQDLPPPPIPEIKSYIDVGLSAVTRSLQESASRGPDVELSPPPEPRDQGPASRPYSAIFVARSGQPTVLNGHLPQMVAAACEAQQGQAPIRLVGLSKACGDRLSESLGVPRVSCIGLREEAPKSKALVEFTRRHVPVVEAQWLEEARQGEHKGTNINAVETCIGRKKQPNRGPPKS
ncbi:hypothetical protein GGS23DRAFT_568457 [Durotheca rogersii]|uniref:uncharacterized protein n=1 Tax=Durotheca rogersii TaxID=419775 RepID=UPI00221EF0DD|nr:uncharacterized protein GGS23DRAFT_568457 [Durotheca rogersii]KAI5863138.1 hypothetical protein GGS23DRAFT_568457 [Durotheca rogersii]